MTDPDSVFAISAGICGVAFLVHVFLDSKRNPRHSNVPEPIRRIINSFSTESPEEFRENVEALRQAMMEVAAEIGPCPSCGSDPDTHTPPTKYPHVIRIARGRNRGIETLYCGTCGVESIESNQPLISSAADMLERMAISIRMGGSKQ